MSDHLLQDVDQMMRQERLKALWHQYGNYIIGGILALILGVGLSEGYKAWSASRAEQATAQIQAALTGKETEKALADLAQSQNRGNAAAIARLLAAGKAMEAEKFSEARDLLLAVRNDALAPQDFRDLATLQWVRLSEAEKDANPEHLLGALQPLMRDDGQPWAWQARIEAAVITANLKNDPATALKILEPMANNLALPMPQVERAEALASVYRLRLGQDAAAVTPSSGKDETP